MRVAVAGFMHESNTFNPLRTDRGAFAPGSLSVGRALLDEWRRFLLYRLARPRGRAKPGKLRRRGKAR